MYDKTKNWENTKMKCVQPLQLVCQFVNDNTLRPPHNLHIMGKLSKWFIVLRQMVYMY